jgi:hypothetical protein
MPQKSSDIYHSCYTLFFGGPHAPHGPQLGVTGVVGVACFNHSPTITRAHCFPHLRQALICGTPLTLHFMK